MNYTNRRIKPAAPTRPASSMHITYKGCYGMSVVITGLKKLEITGSSVVYDVKRTITSTYTAEAEFVTVAYIRSMLRGYGLDMGEVLPQMHFDIESEHGEVAANALAILHTAESVYAKVKEAGLHTCDNQFMRMYAQMLNERFRCYITEVPN